MSTPPPGDAADRPRRRFTRVEYEALIDAGIVKEGEPVELIFGEIVSVSPETDHHFASRQRLIKALMFMLRDRADVFFDRSTKALLYAVSDVLEYWVVDLVHGLVEVRRERDAGEWRSLTTYRRGQSIPLLAFPDVQIEVSEILPPA